VCLVAGSNENGHPPRGARLRANARGGDGGVREELAGLPLTLPNAAKRRTHLMKNIVHFFSREVVLAFMDTIKETRSKNYEFVAAVMVQRAYEKDWGPTMIGFYMNREYAHRLEQMEKSGVVDHALLMDALTNGIEDYHHIDFVLCTASGEYHQEFQLKRFGMRGQENTTEGLITYLNEFRRQYGPTDAACLIALTELDKINLPKVRDEFEREAFPFTELLLIGVVGDEFVIAGLLPKEGWSTYDLSEVVR
jgi:hypothetical protein